MTLTVALSAALLSVFVLVGALDLGVGLLLPLVARGRDRDAVLTTGGHPWLGGATWTLITFTILVAFLPASLEALRSLWPPLILMVVLLALRAAVSSLRPVVLRQDLIDIVHGVASLAAVGCQGLMLGWSVDALGHGTLPVTSAPLGFLSIWGVLAAGGLVGLYSLVGAGWLVLSGRGAVSTFGREVGHAAALAVVGAMALCSLWSAPSGVAARVVGRGSGLLAFEAISALVAVSLLGCFWFSLWGRRPRLPAILAAVTVLALIGALEMLLWADPSMSGDGSAGGYLGFLLLIGSPLVIADLMRRRAQMAYGCAPVSTERSTWSHAGRRSGSLANDLHLS